jgi:hypothetical protein
MNIYINTHTFLIAGEEQGKSNKVWHHWYKHVLYQQIAYACVYPSILTITFCGLPIMLVLSRYTNGPKKIGNKKELKTCF